MRYFAKLGESSFVGDPTEISSDMIEMNGPNQNPGFVAHPPIEGDTLGWWGDPPFDLTKAVDIKIAQIDMDTSEAIIQGFIFPIFLGETDEDGITEAFSPEDGKGTLTYLHFSYNAFDQQNFADTGNGAQGKVMGIPGLPNYIEWNGYRTEGEGETITRIDPKELVVVRLPPTVFLQLYYGGALLHKATQMGIGKFRKLQVKEALTQGDLDKI